jgi:hypothetical protein
MSDGDKELLPVWMLNSKDKAIHRQMAHARSSMRKVASLLRQYKQQSEEWQAHAEQISGAADILESWMNGLRSEAKENKKSGL